MASPNSAHESPKLTLRKLISELKGLLERERIALDLKAGQGLTDTSFAAKLADPFGLQADRVQEAAGPLDGPQLAENSGRCLVDGCKHPGADRLASG